MPFPKQPNIITSKNNSSKKRVTVVLETGLSSPRIFPTRSSSFSASISDIAENNDDKEEDKSESSESIATTTITYSASFEIAPITSPSKKSAKTSEFWERNYLKGQSPRWSRKTISSSAKARSKSSGPSSGYYRRPVPSTAFPIVPLYSRASSSSSIDYNRMDSGRFTSRSSAREERARKRRIKALFRADENDGNNSPGTSQIEDEEEEEVYRGIENSDDEEGEGDDDNDDL
uniref:Uncharacterized protein n=1 Tax=Panagrolaimus superbus TaxID=310955 RepID=A0A914YDP4_9BILA